MTIVRSVRFPLILFGTLASIVALFWPAVQGARQAAQRAGIT
jgi:hypothetical protein